MGVTKISDIVEPEVYNDYFREASVYKSAFMQSGIATLDPLLKQNLLGGADSFNTPFWKSNTVIGADATPVNEDATIAAAKIDVGKMIARRHFREKAFGQNDVAAVLAGEKPIEAIEGLIEQFWNRNYQNAMFASVQGVIADSVANHSGDMVKDITSEGDNLINSDDVIDTFALFGDMNEDIAAIAMASKPYSTLQKLNLIDFRPDNEQNIGFGTYLGKTIIVDDSLVVGGAYWNVVFKPGAFGFADDMESGNYEPTEVERKPEISGGQEILYTRRVFAAHPFGYAWSDDAAPAATFPTDAELKLAANWTRSVSSVKNTGFAVLKTAG